MRDLWNLLDDDVSHYGWSLSTFYNRVHMSLVFFFLNTLIGQSEFPIKFPLKKKTRISLSHYLTKNTKTKLSIYDIYSTRLTYGQII